MDSVGFTVRYQNQLLAVGSPDAEEARTWSGMIAMGPSTASLNTIKQHALYRFGRVIDRGTPLTYKPNFRGLKQFIESPYLDDRLGICLQLAEIEGRTHHLQLLGRTWWRAVVGFLAKHMYETWRVRRP